MIEPGNVVVITGKDTYVHSGLAAHEFIRSVVMERAGTEYRDDFSTLVKSLGKRKNRHESKLVMRRDCNGPDIQAIGDLVLYGERFE